MFNLKYISEVFQSFESNTNANHSIGNRSSIALHTRHESEAVVTRTIEPGKTGQIKFQGSWWTARCDQGLTLMPGKLVCVISRQNITLYVEPLFSNAIQGH